MRKQTRKIRVLAFAVIAAAAGTLTLGADGLAIAPGEPAPDMRGRSFEGERWSLDYSTSKFTLVNFWATWCEPCKEEMPRLQKLHEELAGQGLHVVGVLRDSVDDQEVLEFLEPFGLTYRMIRPQERFMKGWGGISAYPTSFLVDEAGIVKRRYVGATPEQIEGLVYDVRAAIAGKPMGPFVFASGGSVTDDDRRAQKQRRP